MRVTLENSLMRGREAEWDLVIKLLDSTRRGKSGVLLLDGEPGIGKSLLLDAANDAANAHGFVLAASAAEGLNRFAPLALLPASHAGLGGEKRRAAAGAVPTGNTRAHLEELASAGPVLVGIDDLHWATRPLCTSCARCPACWRRIRCRGSWSGAPRAAAARPRCCSRRSNTAVRRGPACGLWPIRRR